MRKRFVFIFILSLLFVLIGCTPIEKPSYFIMFDGNGGTFVSGIQTQRVILDNVVIAPIYKKEGYTFDGWYLGDEKWDFTTNSITKDSTSS